MEKSPHCRPGHNLRKVDDNLYILCLYAPNREQILKVLAETGGHETSTICEAHEDYYVWWSNQPETEEDQRVREKLNRMNNEAKRRANNS